MFKLSSLGLVEAPGSASLAPVEAARSASPGLGLRCPGQSAESWCGVSEGRTLVRDCCRQSCLGRQTSQGGLSGDKAR